ncbi:MAG: CDP-diacylglycerol--serine O-phosphatidyltransferase [Thermoplasmata archaeon]|nr:CDP-diacylglycerol--serine O-phosphatidyltransferase [Thermoplasmata archaeon]
MRWIRKISVADLATLGNGMCGFFAVIYTLDRNFLAACLFILCGAMLDGLDGYLARRYPSKHNAGRFLDSISDTISFCFAPAFLLYQQFYSLERGSAFVDFQNFLAVLVPGLIALFGLMRLVKFSLSGYKSQVFHGLPTPASAMLAVSLSLLFGPASVFGENYLPVLLPMCVFAFLMITDIKYPKARGGFYLWLSALAGVCIFFALVGIKFGIEWLARTTATLSLVLLLVYAIFSPLILHRRNKNGQG